MFKNQRIRIGLLGLSVLAALYCALVAFSPEAAVKVVKHSGYWFVLVAFTLLLINLGRCLAGQWSQWRQWGLPPMALFTVLLGSVVLLLAQKSGYKIVMDEPVLSATALQMHLHKEAMTATRGYDVGGSFSLLGGYVDKRPYFFPFLVSLLHDLAGYRPLQGAVLNALLTPLFLGLVFISGRMLAASQAGGYLAVGLFMTVPLLSMVVNSVGFDLLNLVMILAALLAAVAYLKKPEYERLNVLLLTAVLLAQTRYESVIYVFVVAVVVFVAWWRAREIMLSKTALIVPLLLICVPLQHALFNEYPQMWQLDDGVSVPFMLSFIPANLVHASNYFFSIDGELPNSLLLSLLFALSVLIAIPVLAVSKFGEVEVESSFFLFGAGMLAGFILLMAYHWGQIDDVAATRIVLPFLLLQVLFCVWTLGKLPRGRAVVRYAAWGSFLFFLSVARPRAAASSFLWWADLSIAVNWQQEKMAAKKHLSPFVATPQFILPVSEKIPAIALQETTERKKEIALHRQLGTFGEMLFFDYCLVDPGSVTELKLVSSVDPCFECELIDQLKLRDGYYMGLWRLIRVQLSDAETAEVNQWLDVAQANPDAKVQLYLETLP
jgi:hypothetical protein